MALYNNVTGEQIKAQSAGVANETERQMARVKYFAESLAKYDAATLTALGLDADYQANLGSMKAELLALEAWYQANSTFLKRFAQMLAF